MTQLFDAAFSPLPLIFGIPLVICLALWAVSITGAFDLDADTGDGALDEALNGLGIATVPPLIFFTIVSAIAWFIAIVIQILIVDTIGGGTAIALAIIGGVLALAAGIFLGARVSRPLVTALETSRAPAAADLVGHAATVRSGRVDTDFGYADADWDDGTQSRVQIRDDQGRGLTAGDRVRLTSFDPTADTFAVVTEDEMFPDSGGE